MTWYQSKYNFSVESREIDRATDHYVFFPKDARGGQRREGMHTDYGHWFPSRDEAVAFSRERLTVKITYAKEHLAELEAKLKALQ